MDVMVRRPQTFCHITHERRRLVIACVNIRHICDGGAPDDTQGTSGQTAFHIQNVNVDTNEEKKRNLYL